MLEMYNYIIVGQSCSEATVQCCNLPLVFHEVFVHKVLENFNRINNIKSASRDHPFGAYAKFSEKLTFLTP